MTYKFIKNLVLCCVRHWKSFENWLAFGRFVHIFDLQWPVKPKISAQPCICLCIMTFRCRIPWLSRRLERSCLPPLSVGIHLCVNLSWQVPMDCFDGTWLYWIRILMYHIDSLTFAYICYVFPLDVSYSIESQCCVYFVYHINVWRWFRRNRTY